MPFAEQPPPFGVPQALAGRFCRAREQRGSGTDGGDGGGRCTFREYQALVNVPFDGVDPPAGAAGARLPPITAEV